MRNYRLAFGLVESETFVVRNHNSTTVSDGCEPDVIMDVVGKVIGVPFDIQSKELQGLSDFLAASPVKEDRNHAAAETATSSKLSASLT